MMIPITLNGFLMYETFDKVLRLCFITYYVLKLVGFLTITDLLSTLQLLVSYCEKPFFLSYITLHQRPFLKLVLRYPAVTAFRVNFQNLSNQFEYYCFILRI